ncbi:MAG: protein TolQ [Pseudomonadota bacterium]
MADITLPSVGNEALQTVGRDLSLIDLFLDADWIVKLVILGLIALSFWCWRIIIGKYRLFTELSRRADRFESLFWSEGTSIDELYERLRSNPRDPLSIVFVAGMDEWQALSRRNYTMPAMDSSKITKRVERTMRIGLARQVAILERTIPLLATTASAAPFIGLFGTVWGIMNSFTAIAAAQQTNLAVVAPGIAEALFATAFGLVAAIPASIAYNKLSQDLNRYTGQVECFIGEFTAYIVRKTDQE